MDWLVPSWFPFQDPTWWQIALVVADYVIKIIAVGVVPANRNPSSSTAWLLVILLIPFLGLPLFLLLGSQAITGRRHRIQARANDELVRRTKHLPDIPEGVDVDDGIRGTFLLNRRLTGMPAVLGVDHGIRTNYEESIAAMIRAIDDAQRTVHVQMYIFALDETTEPFIQALERAHLRGLDVKVLVDPIGSYKYRGYRKLKRRLNRAGIPWHPMLPISIVHLQWRRPDLRNHRKIVTVDGDRAFMGSQNMIESAYQQRAHRKSVRRWVDTMVELTGEVVTELDAVFAVDWASEGYDQPVQQRPTPARTPLDEGGETNLVQVVPSGPGFQTEPNLRVFNDLIYEARERLIIVSPYFVPDESMLMALTTAAHMGIDVRLHVNEKSDQFMVGHAQASYYRMLLESGVRIMRYPAPAVLHAKFMVVDDRVAAFGSSNLDMRSFGLNYEVTLLATRGSIVPRLIEIADEYDRVSTELTLEEWKRRPWPQRYLDNLFRLTSALQ
ncbi:cardiolipin synthase [Corynebacterium sp. 335C]